MVCVLVFFLLPTNCAVMGASAVAYFFSFVQKESDFLSFTWGHNSYTFVHLAAGHLMNSHAI